MPLLLLLLIAAAAAGEIHAAAVNGDAAALLQFKHSITADPAGLLSNWSGHVCTFPGVACTAASRVAAVNISGFCAAGSCAEPSRQLTGTLTSSLGLLSELRILSLPFHRLRGTVPSSIWNLEKLETLDLSGNSFSGTLPVHFPSSLIYLNLAGNSLSGAIPVSLSLNLVLEYLDLSGNELVGGIPRSIGNCSEMKTMLLYSNLLGGSLPGEIGRLKKLRVLDVSRNALSGEIPVEIGECRELSVLVLTNLFELKDGGSDEFNCFQGGLPEGVTALPKLRVLWAPRATVEGDVPSDWGGCEWLEMVNLGKNVLTGQIPRVFAQCKKLRFLDLSSNRLTGWIDEQLAVPCMDVFDVSGNQLSGSIPRFMSKTCSPLSFPPDDLGMAYYSLFAYRARVATSLPYFERGGDYAIYHNFGKNNLTGSLSSLPIEPRYRNRTVYAFLADGNHLTGSLSEIIDEKCKDLNGLVANLSNNMISGEIPAKIGNICTSLLVLDVAGNRITGAIPQSFGSMRNLVSLDLNKNRLQGQIPAKLGRVKGLNTLSLAGNNLSGQIPGELVQISSLCMLDLSSNSLTGEIPSGLLNLRNLTVLILSNNKLSGQIPSGLANLKSLSMFNVSFNNLSGPLPSNVSMVICKTVIGNPLLLQPCHVYSLSISPSELRGHSGDSQTYSDSPPESSHSTSSNSGFNSIEIACITSAVAIVSALLLLILIYVYTRKCTRSSAVQSPGKREVTMFTEIGVPLTYESVVRATGSFNTSNCIGSGGFGATYKAEVSPGVLVAIKKLSTGRFHGVKQFHAEIKTLGRLRHPNLVTLIGYHLSEDNMFLVYNYLPCGNLDKFIHERSKRDVDWRMLHKIALDVACALNYLHEQCVPRIIHRDVKPSNILLDSEYTAYLSDFGLARLLGNSETHATTGVEGTYGYVAPEYALTCRVSDKADVYSYGIVLMELISDKKVLDPSFSPHGNGFDIVRWASMLRTEGRAHEFFIPGLWDVAPHDNLLQTLRLAIKCTDEKLSDRPAMRQVVHRLKELQPPAS